MINDIIQAIADKLTELYPGTKIYVDDVPQDVITPSFLVTLVTQNYRKRIYGNSVTITFDLAYFSDKGIQDIKEDCRAVQQNLLRNFGLIGAFRAAGKSARTVDNVLHLTFNVQYAEIDLETKILMQKHQTNTNL
jgi:hypothetical protein